jgi:hypothetical protein
MIQHDLIQNVLIQNVLIQNALIQKCPDSKCPGLVARHGEELWIYEYKYTKKDTSPGHFESGHFESRHFESGHFESGHVESGHFESGHVESWRFVTVPYHYCSIYVRSYTRRWSRMSSFKQKNQNTKSWSGAINLWIQIQIHKKRIDVLWLYPIITVQYMFVIIPEDGHECRLLNKKIRTQRHGAEL